jgi:hypothetical protein
MLAAGSAKPLFRAKQLTYRRDPRRVAIHSKGNRHHPLHRYLAREAIGQAAPIRLLRGRRLPLATAEGAIGAANLRA